MINESSYWKDDLLKQAGALQRRATQKRWHEASSARLEQSVMLGFYSIRKLAEAKKLTNRVVRQKLQLMTYPWLGNSVTKLNWQSFWELYDLDAGRIAKCDLLFLCHQFVHSYVFALSFGNSGSLNEILVSSDRERNHQLYGIGVKQIIRLFTQVGHDYPDSIAMVFNPRKQDYDVRND